MTSYILMVPEDAVKNQKIVFPGRIQWSINNASINMKLSAKTSQRQEAVIVLQMDYAE